MLKEKLKDLLKFIRRGVVRLVTVALSRTIITYLVFQYTIFYGTYEPRPRLTGARLPHEQALLAEFSDLQAEYNFLVGFMMPLALIPYLYFAIILVRTNMTLGLATIEKSHLQPPKPYPYRETNTDPTDMAGRGIEPVMAEREEERREGREGRAHREETGGKAILAALNEDPANDFVSTRRRKFRGDDLPHGSKGGYKKS